MGWMDVEYVKCEYFNNFYMIGYSLTKKQVLKLEEKYYGTNN